MQRTALKFQEFQCEVQTILDVQDLIKFSRFFKIFLQHNLYFSSVGLTATFGKSQFRLGKQHRGKRLITSALIKIGLLLRSGHRWHLYAHPQLPHCNNKRGQGEHFTNIAVQLIYVLWRFAYCYTWDKSSILQK